jgi:hypothetical protein
MVDPITGNTLFKPGCYRIYSYYGVTYTANALTGDTQLTMQAAGYFNNVSGDLQVGDLIIAWSAIDNNYQVYQVTTVIVQGVSVNVLVVPTSLNPAAGTSIVVPVTAAQLLGMNAAPVLMLPAPGLGYAYQIIEWAVNMITAGAPTVYANGGPLVLEYGNAAAGAGPVASATIPATVLTTGTPNNIGMAGTAAGFAQASAGIVNTAIYLSNTTAAFINGTGIANILIDYRIIPAV